MKNYCEYFRGKKITLMGLGLLGRGVGDAAFLSECGAELTVTDKKSEKELADSLKKLKSYKNIQFVLGRHRKSDFVQADMVIKAAGVPLDSEYVNAAREAGVPVTMSAALFVKLLPRDATVVGITGTRGKSTVAHLLHHILKIARKRVFLGGNVKGISTLALLPKVKVGDVIVLELDSWQLQGFGYEKVSPEIAVFTNFLPDHMNYYGGSMAKYWNDKAQIFGHQSGRGVIIAGREVAPRIRKDARRKGSVVVPAPLPKNWRLKIPGEHNRENAAFAVAAARRLGAPRRAIKKAVLSFKGVPGRLELLRILNGVKIYNDTTATTPYAAATALGAIGDARKKNVVLIAGGSDKGLDVKPLKDAIKKYCKAVIWLPGTGTEKIKNQKSKIKVTIQSAKNLKEIVGIAMNKADRGDTVLFSPGFASFGMFKNEFDRDEQFRKEVGHLTKKKSAIGR